MNTPFRRVITQEYLFRLKGNANYSLRSYARSLGVDPATVSQIINRKRTLTDKMCLKFAAGLSMSPERVKSLLSQGKLKKDNVDSFHSFGELQEEEFKTITDWYHYAILELINCEGFQGNERWIAKALKLPHLVVRDAIERLEKLGFLIITPQGKWIDNLGDVNNLGNQKRGEAFKEHQSQLLGKAHEALEATDYAKRVQSSMVLAGSSQKVKAAKEKILNFIEELDQFMKNDPHRDEVFTISVSLFPLSDIKTGD